MVTVSTFGQLYDAMARNEREIKINCIYNEAEWKRITKSEVLTSAELRGMNSIIVLEALGCINNRATYGNFSPLVKQLNKIYYKKKVTSVFPMCKEYINCYKVKEVSESKTATFIIMVRK